jgi:hypothetical protein
MFFGEFLLMKNIISEEQLLDALIFQVENLPSFLRVLKEEKLLSSSEIVRIIQKQLLKKTDIVSILREENIVDEPTIKKLYQRQVEGRKMLGRALVELKMIEQSVIEKMLFEFLQIKDNLQKNIQQESAEKTKESVKETVDEKVTEKKSNLEISDAALESMKELGLSIEEFLSPSKKIETTFVENESSLLVDKFLNIFNEKMKNKFIKVFSFISQSIKDESNISNYFNTLYRDLHVMKEAALQAELTLSGSLIGEWEAIVEKKMTLDNDHLSGWTSDSLPLMDEAINYLWEIRELISFEKNEDSIKNTTELYEKYLALQSSMKLLS